MMPLELTEKERDLVLTALNDMRAYLHRDIATASSSLVRSVLQAKAHELTALIEMFEILSEESD